MIIRQYTKEDIDGVVSVSKEFAEISTMSKIPFVEEDTKEFMLAAIDNENFFKMFFCVQKAMLLVFALFIFHRHRLIILCCLLLRRGGMSLQGIAVGFGLSSS